MKTEVEVTPHEIVGGETLAAKPYELNNFYLHTCLTQLSRAMASCAESQTANAYAEVVPSEVADLQMAWAAFKETFDFALLHNDPPTGDKEDIWTLWLLSKNQIMKCPNEKMKIILMHLYNLCNIIVTCDSAKFSANVASSSETKIKRSIAVVEAAIDKWLGKGTSNADVGIEMPSNIRLGQLVPDVDFDKGTTREASGGYAPGAIPDAVDRRQGGQ